MPKVVWKQHPGGKAFPATKSWRGYVSGKWMATIKVTPAGKFRRHWRDRAKCWLPTVEALLAKSFNVWSEAVEDVELMVKDFWLPEPQARIKPGRSV